MNKLWYLSQISIFEAMSREEIREIDQLDTIHHFDRITKNTLVQTPESAREGLYFVKEGKLRLYKLNDSGKKVHAWHSHERKYIRRVKFILVRNQEGLY